MGPPGGGGAWAAPRWQFLGGPRPEVGAYAAATAAVVLEAAARERAWDPELRPRYERMAAESEPEHFPEDALAAALEEEFARAYDAAAARAARAGEGRPLAEALGGPAYPPGPGSHGWAAAATARLSHAALERAVGAALVSSRPERGDLAALERELRVAFALTAADAARRLWQLVAGALLPELGPGAPPAGPGARGADLAAFRRAARAAVAAAPLPCVPRALHLFFLAAAA